MDTNVRKRLMLSSRLSSKGSLGSGISPCGSLRSLLSPSGSLRSLLSPSGSIRNLSPSASIRNLSPSGSLRDLFSRSGSLTKVMDTNYPPVPKRPLTSYNLFSILERNYILQQDQKKASSDSESNMETVQGDVQGGDSDPYGAERPQRYRDLVLPRDWYVVGMNRTKRKDHKSHGLISFNNLTKTLSYRWMVADDEVKAYCKHIAGEELKKYRREQDEYKKKYGKEAFEAQKKKYKRRKTDEDESMDGRDGATSKNDSQVAQMHNSAIQQNNRNASAMSAFFPNRQAFSSALRTTGNWLVGAFPSTNNGFAGSFYPTEEGANAEQQEIQSRIEHYTPNQRMSTNMLDANAIYTSATTRNNSAVISNTHVASNDYDRLAAVHNYLAARYAFREANLLTGVQEVATEGSSNEVDASTIYASTASRRDYDHLAAMHNDAVARNAFRGACLSTGVQGGATGGSSNVGDASTIYTSMASRHGYDHLASVNNDAVPRDAFRGANLSTGVQGSATGWSPTNSFTEWSPFSEGHELLCQPCSPKDDTLEDEEGNQAMMGFAGGLSLPLGRTDTNRETNSSDSSVASGELLPGEEVSKAFDSDSDNE